MDKEKINKMTLREVMEYTKNISIQEGGLSILIEKIVSEIEDIERKVNNINNHIIKND